MSSAYFYKNTGDSFLLKKRKAELHERSSTYIYKRSGDAYLQKKRREELEAQSSSYFIYEKALGNSFVLKHPRRRRRDVAMRGSNDHDSDNKKLHDNQQQQEEESQQNDEDDNAEEEINKEQNKNNTSGSQEKNPNQNDWLQLEKYIMIDGKRRLIMPFLEDSNNYKDILLINYLLKGEPYIEKTGPYKKNNGWDNIVYWCQLAKVPFSNDLVYHNHCNVNMIKGRFYQYIGLIKRHREDSSNIYQAFLLNRSDDYFDIYNYNNLHELYDRYMVYMKGEQREDDIYRINLTKRLNAAEQKLFPDHPKFYRNRNQQRLKIKLTGNHDYDADDEDDDHVDDDIMNHNNLQGREHNEENYDDIKNSNNSCNLTAQGHDDDIDTLNLTQQQLNNDFEIFNDDDDDQMNYNPDFDNNSQERQKEKLKRIRELEDYLNQQQFNNDSDTVDNCDDDVEKDDDHPDNYDRPNVLLTKELTKTHKNENNDFTFVQMQYKKRRKLIRKQRFKLQRKNKLKTRDLQQLLFDMVHKQIKLHSKSNKQQRSLVFDVVKRGNDSSNQPLTDNHRINHK